MPSTTTNYGLHIYNNTTDKIESFENFRDDVAGTGTNSNMYIIDGKLKEWRDDIDALENRQGVIRVPMTKDGANHYSASGISGITLSYPLGLTIVAIPDSENDGTTILNINSIGDVSLVKINEAGTPVNLQSGELVSNRLYLFQYNGTNFEWISPTTLDQIYAQGNTGELIKINSGNALESTGATIDTSTDLGGGSSVNSKIPTQLAIKTYVDSLISNANALVYKGVIDCSSNPDYPSADAGWLYIISVSGKIGGSSGENVESGDMMICKVDSSPSGNQATVGSNWNIIQKNIEGYVLGASSSVDGSIAVFDGVTGKVIKEGLPSNIKALLDLEIGTDVQAYNSVLTTLAGASANGQSLVTAADYSAMRSLLGLVIGTNVQAYDADLTTWAGKTAPSGDVIGNTDTQTLTNKDLKSVTNTHEEFTTVASSSSITPTGGSYRNRITITALAEGTTINAPSGTPVDGNVLLIRIKDNGTSRSVAFNSIFRAVGATLLSATTISKTSYIMATYNSAESKWDVTVCITEA